MSANVKTVEEVKRDLDRRGKSVREWAREHGFSERIVYEVLRGRLKGRRGQTHKVAVLLGLKDGIVE
ncbi:MAG: DNA-binding protein [Pseudomonadota bacterium]